MHWGSLRSHMFLCLFQVLGSGRRMPCTFRLCQWPELHSCMRFCQWLEIGNKCFSRAFPPIASQTRARQTTLGHLALPRALVFIPSARVWSMHAFQIPLVPVGRAAFWNAVVVTLRARQHVLLPVVQDWQQCSPGHFLRCFSDTDHADCIGASCLAVCSCAFSKGSSLVDACLANSLVPVPRVALSKSALAEQTTPAALALTDIL